MEKEQDHLKAITEIRSMMERSSRFISLSGLSGVFAGIFALMGVYAVYSYFNLAGAGIDYYEYIIDTKLRSRPDFYFFFVADASIVLGASLLAGMFFTMRKAKSKGLSIWDATAKRLVINMFIPLAAGGLFCIVLLTHGLIGLLAPVTLIFYGLALFNASKYTLNDIRYLGLCEIALGLISSFYLGYGLIFWAIGFGILHIIYGTVMYFKYER